MVENLTAITTRGDTESWIKMEFTFWTGSHFMTFNSFMIQNNGVLFILPDGSKTTPLTSPRPLAWAIIHFRLYVVYWKISHSHHHPILSKVGVTIPTGNTNKNIHGNYWKVNWQSINCYITHVPHYLHCGNLHVVHKSYLQTCHQVNSKRLVLDLWSCLDEGYAELLKEYEESGNPDIATHLLSNLNASRMARREEVTMELNMSSSCKALAPMEKNLLFRSLQHIVSLPSLSKQYCYPLDKRHKGGER